MNLLFHTDQLSRYRPNNKIIMWKFPLYDQLKIVPTRDFIDRKKKKINIVVHFVSTINQCTKLIGNEFFFFT